MYKNITQGVLLSSTTILVLLLMLELVLRIAGFSAPQALAYDKVLGYVPKPSDTVTTTKAEFSTTRTINELGFFGTLPGELASSTIRIATLGDSFTEARQVAEHESYPAVLLQALTQATTTPYALLNLGRTTSGIEKETYIYNRYSGEYAPNIVILGLYIGNDFDDALREHAPNFFKDKNLTTFEKFKINVGLLLVNNSAAANFYLNLKARNVVLAKEPIKYIKEASFSKIATDISTTLSTPTVKETPSEHPLPSEFIIFEDELTTEAKEGYALATNSLAALHNTLTKNGVRFIVVVIPDKAQVYEEARAPEWPTFDYTKPNRLLAEFFERESIEYLDLLPILTNDYATSGMLAYYLRDGHFNPRGHALAGDAIAYYLLGTTTPRN